MTTMRGSMGLGPSPAPDYRQPSRWWDDAECRDADPTLFHPIHGETASDKRDREADALRICAACPVRRECLEDNLQSSTQGRYTDSARYGIVGGLTEEQRLPLIKAAREAAREDGTLAAYNKARCGTASGANVHYRRGEKLCPLCVEGQREYNRQKPSRAKTS